MSFTDTQFITNGRKWKLSFVRFWCDVFRFISNNYRDIGTKKVVVGQATVTIADYTNKDRKGSKNDKIILYILSCVLFSC